LRPSTTYTVPTLPTATAVGYLRPVNGSVVWRGSSGFDGDALCVAVLAQQVARITATVTKRTAAVLRSHDLDARTEVGKRRLNDVPSTSASGARGG
jgi:hypothetical protein